MCFLTAFIAPMCGHPTKYEYRHCAASPYPKRCPELVDSIAETAAEENLAYCPPCWVQAKAKIIADFNAEKRMVTSTARAEGCWTEDEIGEMMEELDDQIVDRLNYGNRVLPPLPQDETQETFPTAATDTGVEKNDGEAAEIREQLKE